MRSVLLIVDLEGVAGVDDVASLLAVAPGYPRACELLTEEVRAVLRGLRARGIEHIRIADTHRGGARGANVRSGALGAGIEVRVDADPWAPDVFAGVDAIACLGMHASARSDGFAAHTMSIHCAFSVGGRDLSETDIALALAAEHGVPALFVTGDDVLERDDRGCAFLRTKVARSRAAAVSQPIEAVRAALEELARTAAPVATRALPSELVVAFKRRWQADLGERVGGVRRGPHELVIDDASFGASYRRALPIIAASDRALGAAMRTFDPAALGEDVAQTLCGGFSVAPQPAMRDAAERALAWFVDACAGDAAWQRAQRALVMMMLRGHAPRFFREHGLDAELRGAIAGLAAIPTTFPRTLHPMDAMARLDAVYVAREHDVATSLDTESLREYVLSLVREQPLLGWLMSELAVQCGVPRIVTSLPPRALRGRSRLQDLYWLTHEILLDTRYLTRALPPRGWESRGEEVALGIPYVCRELRIDLAAELAFCLQAAREGDSAAHETLVSLVARHQDTSGRVDDPPTAAVADADDRQRRLVHTTSAALIAFAWTAEP